MPTHPAPSVLTLLGAALACAASAGGSAPAGRSLPSPVLTTPVREVAVAAAPDGTVFLAALSDSGRFSSGRGTFTARTLRAWKAAPGGPWTPLSRQDGASVGGPLGLNDRHPRPAANLNLSADRHGSAVLAWNENYGDNDIVHLRALRPGGWTDWPGRYLGDDLPYAARTRAVAAWKGEAVLAWGEFLRSPDGSQLTVRRWNDTPRSWVRGPAFNDPRAYARTPALALTRAGQPVVAWLQGDVTAARVLAARWDGQAWQALGGPLNRHPPGYVAATRLVLDGQDRPIAAWLEDHAGQDTLYAARWNGQHWQAMGGPLSAAFASAPTLSTDPAGHAVLAWVQERGGQGQVHAARWTGRYWQGLGVQNRDPRRDARSPSVTTDDAGRTTLAWREDGGGIYQIQLRQIQLRQF